MSACNAVKTLSNGPVGKSPGLLCKPSRCPKEPLRQITRRVATMDAMQEPNAPLRCPRRIPLTTLPFAVGTAGANRHQNPKEGILLSHDDRPAPPSSPPEPLHPHSPDRCHLPARLSTRPCQPFSHSQADISIEVRGWNSGMNPPHLTRRIGRP